MTLFRNRWVYLTGGMEQAAKLVSVYDIATNTWKDYPELIDGRNCHTSCSLGSSIYVFGGVANLCSIEKFDTSRKNKGWVEIVQPSKLIST